jgi:hypothetical protein
MAVKSKALIIHRLQAERRRLEQNLAGLGEQDYLRPGVVGDWSVKDVLAHLSDWQGRMTRWIEAIRRGEPAGCADLDLNRVQVDELNARIYAAHCDQLLELVLEEFHTNFERCLEMIAAMPEEELLEPGRYPFKRNISLYDWLGGFASHDLWGKTKIRSWLKTRQDL